ncbi:HlyD family secretion protein [Chelatococcus reniformis]|uniref:Hemolysin D n=1 Tax=Chelatococcus reniformis TaxID=1494448 RepID=A0A916U2I6_9HYPH|nr:HlyD family secretion protein [Chelatococcus reniformis]GGC57160.1 hemolysin D [Chelatococcus reniformis]
MDRRENVEAEPGGAGAGPGDAPGTTMGLPRAAVLASAQDAVARGPGPAAPSPGGRADAPRPAPAGAADAPVPARKRGRKRFIAIGLVMAALGAGGYFGYNWWTVGRFHVATDDAYVRADMTILASKVSGYVTSVKVVNNQSVTAGELIAKIDDGDYVLAAQSARGKMATQQATVARIAEQTKAAQASVDQAQALIPANQADLVRTAAELERQNQLAQRDYASQQKLETARADRARADAGVKGAQAGLAAAKANVAVLNAQRVEAEHLLAELKTAVAKAERDLSFTEIRAPIDGTIGNKAVQVGQFVQPGVRLAALVPLDAVYVDANFKETQLARLRPGQAVEITVDAFPDRSFAAVVESMSPASGALFSLLPPDNATGNFTKIVQRVPVRLRLKPEATAEHVLRPGMSVVATVSVKDGETSPTGRLAHNEPQVQPRDEPPPAAADQAAAKAAPSPPAAEPKKAPVASR